MRKENVVCHSLVRDFYGHMKRFIPYLQQLCAEDGRSPHESADTAYLCREIKSMLDEIKTEINKLERQAQDQTTVICMVLGETKVTTEYCTASLNPKQWFKLPSRREGKEEWFDAIMAYLNIPQEVAEKEVVRIHPPNFVQYMTELNGQGKRVPVDIKDISATENNLRIRKKKEIGE